MSTLAALSLVCGFLLSAHDGGALVAVFPPVGSRHEHRPALGTGPRLPLVEQGGAQLLVCWQDGGAKPFTVEGICNTLWADTFLTIVQQKAVAIVVIAAVMDQPSDSPVLLIVQTNDVIGHARPSVGWVRREAFGRCSA